MTHITELMLSAAVIAALSAGMIALLQKPGSATSKMALPPVEIVPQRAEPLTKVQRLAAIERRLSEVASEQRLLIEDLKAASREGKPR